MKIENIKIFRKKEVEIHDTFAEIRNKSEQALKILADLSYIYRTKYDGNQAELELAEKQIISQNKELEILYEKINENCKKFAELIKGDKGD